MRRVCIGLIRLPSRLRRYRRTLNPLTGKAISDTVAALATEAGEDALDTLQNLIVNKNRDVRYNAAYSLAIIGGSRACEIIKAEYHIANDLNLKTPLCLCLSSTGTKDDIKFLIGVLDGEIINEKGEPVWRPIEAAALSLGVLRAADAIPELEKLYKENSSSIPGQTAGEALNWIKKNELSIGLPGSTEEENIIYTVLYFGIPKIHRSQIYFDETNGKIWRLDRGRWVSRQIPKKESPDQYPRIAFEIYVKSDGTAAVVNVDLIFGKLSGKGYTYILKREDNQWHVRSLDSTWIS